MKHVLCGILLGVLGLNPGPTLAQERAPGTRYTEERSGLHGTAVPGVRGGALGYQVKEGLAVEAEGLGYGSQADRERTGRGPGAAEALPEAMGVVGMARVDLARTKTSALRLGLGAGGIVADGAPSDGLRQGATSQADLGGRFGLSENVSLRAAGRYQRQDAFSDNGRDNLGAHVGLKISF